jgi:hypothetical protein
MGNLLEILLLGMISGNTSATAQAAAMPEYVKEANYLALSFYKEIRNKSKAARFYLNTGMTLINGFLIVTHDGFRDSWYPVVALLLVWAIIAKFFQNSAWSKASAKAWRIIQDRRSKEDLIRETMFAASVNRRQLAHQ